MTTGSRRARAPFVRAIAVDSKMRVELAGALILQERPLRDRSRKAIVRPRAVVKGAVLGIVSRFAPG